jgi:preprotein translocase subunit SecF
MQLIKPGTKIDFIGMRRKTTVASLILVILSLVLLFTKGLNWGIDFTGGSEIHVDFHEPVEISELRAAVIELGLSGEAVQQVNEPEDYEFMIRVRDTTFAVASLRTKVLEGFSNTFGADWVVAHSTEAQVGARITIEYSGPKKSVDEINGAIPEAIRDQVTAEQSPDLQTVYIKLASLEEQVEEAMRVAVGSKAFSIPKVDSVGPKVGGELRRKGLQAMFFTLALVLVYIAFRFDLAFAPGAILALFHDVTITLGIFVVIQQEVNMSMIGALLTIIGYSLNDTIVIYDRIRENMQKYSRKDMESLINDSVNETLGRTLATSITTMAALTAFLFMGGPVIETFALAMMIGVVVGTYSTVFVASPMILVMERAKPAIARILVPSDKAGAKIKGTSEGTPARADNNRRFIVMIFMAGGAVLGLSVRAASGAFMLNLGHPDSMMFGLMHESALIGLASGTLCFFILMRHKAAVQFTDETVTELARTTWPDREETIRSTTVVIITTTFIAISLGVFDFIWKRVANIFLYTG